VLPDGIPLKLLKGVTVGSLWMYVLAIIASKPSYPYDVRKMIRETFGFEPPIVTLYTTFYRLERDGFIRKDRGLYSITDRGKAALAKAVSYLRNLANEIEEISQIRVGEGDG
jgi:DNA-binding PadR family transcriptional regulator